MMRIPDGWIATGWCCVHVCIRSRATGRSAGSAAYASAPPLRLPTLELKKFRVTSVVLLVLLLLPASTLCRAADDSSVASCAVEVQQACSGLEDHLELCLSQRSDQLSAACRDQLKQAMALIQDDEGLGACVRDIQTLCADLSPDALASCILQKKGDFSPACQKRLKEAPDSSSDAS